jgi:hypothetical protein
VKVQREEKAKRKRNELQDKRKAGTEINEEWRNDRGIQNKTHYARIQFFWNATLYR